MISAEAELTEVDETDTVREGAVHLKAWVFDGCSGGDGDEDGACRSVDPDASRSSLRSSGKSPSVWNSATSKLHFRLGVDCRSRKSSIGGVSGNVGDSALAASWACTHGVTDSEGTGIDTCAVCAVGRRFCSGSNSACIERDDVDLDELRGSLLLDMEVELRLKGGVDRPVKRSLKDVLPLVHDDSDFASEGDR